jgi:dienelactone hydrolase
LVLIVPASKAIADDEVTRCFLQYLPVTIDNETVQIEVRIHKPAEEGKLPTLVLNHGSTGSGMDPARFKQPVDMPAIASFFVRRGWVVFIPARRGRAGSEGKYDEGFSVIRALGYTCIASRSLAGADRALDDIEAVMKPIRKMPFVDPSRIAMGGVSRGGALSIAYAGMHPVQVKAVINFVGGWLGWPCPTMSSVNQALLSRGAAFPGETLWLYAKNDSYYSLSHSRKNFAAFTAAGGKGFFHEYAVPAKNGHLLPAFPEFWGKDIESYLDRIGLPRLEHWANHANAADETSRADLCF